MNNLGDALRNPSTSKRAEELLRVLSGGFLEVSMRIPWIGS
jgi:hypothetical protein